MTSLTAVPGASSKRWSDVLAANYNNSGADPAAVFADALDGVNSSTSGPDPSGEFSSRCPVPTHNGGTGDQKASLRWRQAADGQVIFHCHAGCEGEDVMTALGLSFVQLRWPRTEYEYRSDMRLLMAIHVKIPTAGGKKRYWWEHVESGTTVNGRGSAWEPVLWCLPDLQAAAADARTAGRKIHLWLCEGEKDAVYVSHVIENNWIPAEERGESWCHLVTTSADGAAQWSQELTTQVVDLGAEIITVLADSDEAGGRRGGIVTEAIMDRSPTQRIGVVSWAGTGARDAAEAIDRFAANWLREAVAAGDADPYLWCSTETGWLFEADTADLNGNPTGRRALHRIVGVGTRGQRAEAIAKWPLRVVATTVDSNGIPVGWEIEMGAGGTRPITVEDLTGSNLEAWNASVGLFIVPTRGLGPALRAYLGHHSVNSPSMSVWDHEGWVDSETFVTGSEVLIGRTGLIGRAQTGGTEWHYGHGDAAEAVQLCADILTFRPLAEAAPVLAWLAAVAVRPHALEESGASFVPMLQIPGDSGTGKTSFLRLATRLFGLSGAAISNVTTAGLVRTLALSTQVVWIDDFANYDDTVRDIIRGGLTGAGRTRGTTASERGIVRDEARAALINSGETAMGVEERAMRQRSVIVPFTERAQGRTSRKAGRESEGQYADMVAMGVDREDRGQGLSRWAGTVVDGLWKASCRVRQGEGASKTSEGSKKASDGVREAAAWRFVEYGAHVLAEWMSELGVAKARVDRLVRVVESTVADAVAAAETRERTGADIYLVTTLVPAYLRTRRTILDTAVSGRLLPSEDLDARSVTRVIRDAWKTADVLRDHNDGRPARGVVLIVGDGVGEGARSDEVVAVALCASALAEWAVSDEGRRTGIGTDKRFVTREGLGMQASAVSVKEAQFPTGAGPDGKLRVKLTPTQTPLYSVVTDPDVIATILGY